jgi:hypothetical protein
MGRIIVLLILIFIFLDSRLKTSVSELHGRKHATNVVPSGFLREYNSGLPPSSISLTFFLLALQKQSKGKAVPLPPCERQGGEKVLYLLLITDNGTRWGYVVSVTPRPRFTPGERTPGTHCTGGWVGPRAGLDTEARGKVFTSAGDRTPVVQSVVRYYTD